MLKTITKLLTDTLLSRMPLRAENRIDSSAASTLLKYMARIFTITEGVENMGAIKTGGQGSIYKARRYGEIISAIKILPTPVFSESEADKNYTAFLNEVQKLK